MNSTVLVVEDSKNWYDVLNFILSDEGYKVLWANKINEAQALLGSEQPKIDAVIINLNLSSDDSILDGTGYLLLDYIKNKHPQLPRMAISSFLHEASKAIELYERYKVNYVVLKDNFSAPDFLNSLQTAIAATITEEKNSRHENVDRSDIRAGYDVFLAHNHEDKPQIEAIADELRRRGLNPWLDKEQIPPGRWFQDVIQQAISGVKSAAIVFGQSGLGKWQSAELRAFITRCIEADITVIPVLLPGVKEDVPENLLFLNELKWVRFTKSVNDTEALDNLEWGITGKHPKRN